MEDELSFEEALSQLEEVVNKLESGQLSLDESLSQFEKGIALSRLCNKKLVETQQKVEKLVAKDQNLVTEPFVSE